MFDPNQLSCQVKFSQEKLGQVWFNSNCHTRLHLGFSAKLKILQVPACKMEPRSGYISCKTPALHLCFERLVSQIILIRYPPYFNKCRHIGLFGTGLYATFDHVTFVPARFVQSYNFILAHSTYISSVALPAQLISPYFATKYPFFRYSTFKTK